MPVTIAMSWACNPGLSELDNSFDVRIQVQFQFIEQPESARDLSVHTQHLHRAHTAPLQNVIEPVFHLQASEGRKATEVGLHLLCVGKCSILRCYCFARRLLLACFFLDSKGGISKSF